MNKIETFNQFLATTKGNIGISDFLLNLIIAAMMSLILSWIYIKFGRSLSNRKQFAANFIIITMTTMLIISIVKSSLALSLGLVGALSIVRFRTAVKEPEELAFMFLSIAIGLGTGASQTQITLIGFALIVVAIIVRGWLNRSGVNGNFFINLTSSKENTDLETLKKLFSNYCSKAEIKRINDTKNSSEIVLLVEFVNSTNIQKLRTALQDFDKNIKISIFENRELI